METLSWVASVVGVAVVVWFALAYVNASASLYAADDSLTTPVDEREPPLV